MRGIFVLVGIAVLMSAVSAIGLLVIGDVSGAVLPGVIAVTNGFALYRLIKNPPQPKPWTKARVVVSAVLSGTVTLAVIGMLAWTAVFIPDRPIRVVASLCIVFVVGVVLWTIRAARKLDRQARTTAL